MEKDFAYLKGIDAHDFEEAGVLHLAGFLRDEAHKETTSKHETTGHRSSTLKQVMVEVAKIIQRENDRKASRNDRKSVGGKKTAFAGEGTPLQRRHTVRVHLGYKRKGRVWRLHHDGEARR